MILLYIVLLLVNSIIIPVLSLPSGAPGSACDSLEPSHGANVPQTSDTPFTIFTQALNIGDGKTLQVEIHSTPTSFRGFAIQARSTSPPYHTVGTFHSSPLFRSVNCSGTDSTVTHLNTDTKADLTLLWEAPEDFTGEIIFKATVAQQFNTYWTGIESEPVRVPLIIPEEQNVFNYAECGVNKNCFGFQSGCIETRSCLAIASAKLVGDKYEFEVMTGHEHAAYVATGLSVSGHMPNSSIIECTADNSVNAYAAYTSGESPYYSSREGVPQNIIRLINGSFVNGVIYCKVERIALGTIKDQEFDLNNTKYHVLVAVGKEFSDTGIHTHSLGKWSSKRAVYLSEIQDTDADLEPTPETTREPEITTLEPPQDNEIYKGCGLTKNSFGFPAGCESGRTCRALSTVVRVGDKFVFELMTVLRDAAYVAVGLSRDGAMGNSSVIECIPNANSVAVYKSLTTGRPNLFASREGIRQGVIRLLDGSVQDGVIYCKVEREPFGMLRDLYFNLNNISYHLLVAVGSNINENSITRHNLGRIASEEPYLLSDINEITASKNLLVRLHASFMITAWVLCSTTGILMAKYFKTTWVHVQVGGASLWFVVHRTCMILTWILTMAGFTIIFIDIGTWSADDSPHAILGTIATVLCFLQPFGAMLRPAPTHKNRKIFNFFHYLGGYLAQAFAVATIMFAFTLVRSELPSWFPFLMAGFIAFNLITEVALLVLRIMNYRKKTANLKPTTNDSSSTNNMLSNLEQEDEYSESKKLILLIYVIGAVAFMIALVAVISLSPFDE